MLSTLDASVTQHISVNIVALLALNFEVMNARDHRPHELSCGLVHCGGC